MPLSEGAMRAGINSTGIGRPGWEDYRLLARNGCYNDDYQLPGRASAAMVRSPHAHALIRSSPKRYRRR
jgi:CO/xanthine dehydrogenase Mo-binding subunit